jgi:restriction system protein
MKWEMAENSLFAILLRSQWWISAGIAALMVGVAMVLIPEPYHQYRIIGALTSLPFLCIAAVAGWKQLQKPSSSRVDKTREAVRAMSWLDFAGALEAGYRRDGYEVKRVSDAAADFEIRKDWRTALVSGKRWKVARTGIEPLRELKAAKDMREAHDCVYITIGEITDNARQFALDNKILMVGGAELARLLPRAAVR